MFQVRPDALSFVALVLGHDFALGEKPQFKNSETLKISYGIISYSTEKRN